MDSYGVGFTSTGSRIYHFKKPRYRKRMINFDNDKMFVLILRYYGTNKQLHYLYGYLDQQSHLVCRLQEFSHWMRHSLMYHLAFSIAVILIITFPKAKHILIAQITLLLC